MYHRLHHNPDRFPKRSLYSVLRSSEMTTTIEISTCLSNEPRQNDATGHAFEESRKTNSQTSCCRCPHPHDESPSHDPRKPPQKSSKSCLWKYFSPRRLGIFKCPLPSQHRPDSLKAARNLKPLVGGPSAPELCFTPRKVNFLFETYPPPHPRRSSSSISSCNVLP